MKLRGEGKTAILFLLACITLALITSAASPTPEELSPPRITSPLYEGAEVVEVWGFTPKAEVRVYADGVDIGGGHCRFSQCIFNVKKISAGQKITAKQIVEGVPSESTRDEHAVTVQKIPDSSLDPKYNKERLIAPLVDSPLFECQGIVPVKDIVAGAFVQVFSQPDTQHPIGETRSPWNYARPVVTGLKKDQQIAANQKLLFANPSDLSGPAAVVQAKPTQVPQPVIDENDLVVGSDAVGIWNLLIGAKVDIYYEETGGARESIGGGFAPWPGTIFSVKPLKDTWAACTECIKASQSLCDVNATSAGGTVKNLLEPPVIQEPVCAGSSEVAVCNLGPNPVLTLFRTGNPDQAMAQQGAMGSCTPVTLGDKLSLQNADQIYVTERVGNLQSKSNIVKVADTSDPLFEIRGGSVCQSCPGREDGQNFVRDTLTGTTSGPVFRAAMCGAETARVELHGPNDAILETITLEKVKGKEGYFEGKWDWKQIGWNTSKDIPFGKYRAAFTLWPTGTGSSRDKYFYVSTQGCVNCAAVDFHQACADRINKLRAQESLPALQRNQALEWNADDDARVNYETSTPHAQNSGDAQNQCQLLPSVSQILSGCIENGMYTTEKICYERHQRNDPNACYSLADRQTCECQYGHYENMMDQSYTKVACGIYATPQGSFLSVMDFFR